jgi:hypothetical protein
LGQCRVVSAGLVPRLAGMGSSNTSTSTTMSTRGEHHPQPGPAPTSTIWEHHPQPGPAPTSTIWEHHPQPGPAPTSTIWEHHPQPGPAPTSTIWASTASPRDRAEPAADAPQRVMRAPPYQTWNESPRTLGTRQRASCCVTRRKPRGGAAPPVAGLKKPRESDSGTATAWRGKYVISGGGTPRLIEFPEGLGLLPGDGEVAPPRGGRSRPTGVSTEPRRRETPTHDRAKLKTAAPPGSRATEAARPPRGSHPPVARITAFVSAMIFSDSAIHP